MNKVKPKKLYFVFNEGPDCSYFEQFESIKEAVNTHGHCEVFGATLKRLGVFKKASGIIRVKSKKKLRRK